MAKGRRATRWVIGRVGEAKRTEKAEARVEEWNSIRPSNVFGGGRNGGWQKKNTGTEVPDAVGSSAITVPERPETAGRVRQIHIIGVFGEEVAIVNTSCGARRSSSIQQALLQIDLNKIPASTQSRLRLVRNEEEVVGRSGNGSGKITSGGKSKRNGRVIRGRVTARAPAAGMETGSGVIGVMVVGERVLTVSVKSNDGGG